MQVSLQKHLELAGDLLRSLEKRKIRGNIEFTSQFTLDDYVNVTSYLSPKLAAYLDGFVPDFRSPWNGAFNGQVKRRAIFRGIVKSLPLRAIVETGTYRGTTTDFMHRVSQLPIVTIENNTRCFLYSLKRFGKNKDIYCLNGDSRLILNRLVRERTFPKRGVFFYLDAHWNKDLPLREEIGLILERWAESVIMIDDFQVSGDTGYGFDNYGPGKRLSLNYIKQDMLKKLSIFWPRAASSYETGARRGCVVLGYGTMVTKKLSKLTTLLRQ